MTLQSLGLVRPVDAEAAPVPVLRITPWIAGLVVACFGTAVLFAARPGLNWFLWTAVAAAGFAASAWASGRRLTRAQGALLLLGVALAGGAAVTAQPALQLLVVPCVGMIAALVTLVGAGHRLEGFGLNALIGTPFRAVGACLRSFAGQLRALLRWGRAERGVPVLRGLALALPIVLVFFLLLSTAEPTMAGWRDAAWEALLALSFLPRTAFFAVLAVGSLGALALASQPEPARPAPGDSDARGTGTLHDTERLIVLGAVTALFALFLVLQVSFLFGNPGGRAGSGVTYADAVHRGFWELTVAAALCGVLTLALDHLAVRGARERAVRGVTLLLVAEAGLLLASAGYRVAVYEAAYGYTLERLYAQAHTLLIGVALVLLAREVAGTLDARRLVRRVGLVAALAVGVFCYWNHAAWIVRANVARYAHTGSIDVAYLVDGLGDDALPEVLAQRPALPAPLADDLRVRLAALKAQRAPASSWRWYEWNLRRVAADEALRAM